MLIRASDTDAHVTVAGMLRRDVLYGIPLESIIMDCGSGTNRRFINLTDIPTALESKQVGLAVALPGLHAWTECYYTAPFYQKGKIKHMRCWRMTSVVDTSSSSNLCLPEQSRARPSLSRMCPADIAWVLRRSSMEQGFGNWLK